MTDWIDVKDTMVALLALLVFSGCFGALAAAIHELIDVLFEEENRK